MHLGTIITKYANCLVLYGNFLCGSSAISVINVDMTVNNWHHHSGCPHLKTKAKFQNNMESMEGSS